MNTIDYIFNYFVSFSNTENTNVDYKTLKEWCISSSEPEQNTFSLRFLEASGFKTMKMLNRWKRSKNLCTVTICSLKFQTTDIVYIKEIHNAIPKLIPTKKSLLNSARDMIEYDVDFSFSDWINIDLSDNLELQTWYNEIVKDSKGNKNE